MMLAFYLTSKMTAEHGFVSERVNLAVSTNLSLILCHFQSSSWVMATTSSILLASTKNIINYPAASSGVLSIFRHAGLDPASSRFLLWIPAFAGMTNTRQASGYWTRSE